MTRDLKNSQRDDHKRIILELKKRGLTKSHHHYNDSYTGSKHYFYAVSVPERRMIVKDWLGQNKHASARKVVAFAGTLVAGKSHEEKTMGAYLLGYRKDARACITFSTLDNWLEELCGWAEVDALCQNIFQPEELQSRWKEWERFLRKLARSKNVHKRRAALVFLTGPTWKSEDMRMHTLAYELIDTLKHEKDILITKAISWLLRSMADTRKKDVAEYLKENSETLPKIAVRETRKKLKTGKKN